MSKITKTKADSMLRESKVADLKEVLESQGLDTYLVASNKIAVPDQNSIGENVYVVYTVSIPKGSREGDPFDAKAEADNYQFMLSEKAKAKEKAEAKKNKS